MANAITTAVTFSKESKDEYFLDPIFVNNDIKEILTLRTDIKSSAKLDLISKLTNVVKGSAVGTNFTPSGGVTITQKTLTVTRMKAELEQNGLAFRDYVKQEALKKGVDANDISGTIFEEIISELLNRAILRDNNKHAFFGNTIKEVVTAGVPTGVLDENYKEYNGYWKIIQDDVADLTIPAAQYINVNSTTYLNTEGVAAVNTVTLTGTSGTATLTHNGTGYLVTFNTSLTQTAADFVTSHAAAILARYGKIVVTSSGADVIFTAGVAGQDMAAPSVANVSGDLAGTNAVTTANVDMGTLKTKAASAIFRAMWAGSTKVMRGEKSKLVLVVTDTLYDNYEDELETLNGSAETDRRLINGVERLMWRGIPVMPRSEWDEHIEEDFGDVHPHRALLYLPENLVLGVDGRDDSTNYEEFYDRTNQKNVIRAEFEMGVEYVQTEWLTAAY